MLGKALIFLAFVVVAVECQTKLVYAGFDHLISLQGSDMSVSAFDYKRQLNPQSTCDLLSYPPLVENAHLGDWVSQGARSFGTSEDINLVYMGYEVFLMENKRTGAYVARRCRDFRPQLNMLPCEALVTGTTGLLKAPFKTVWVGNNRVMFLNTETGRYIIHHFDADVHSGGDPFGLIFGPIMEGELPSAGLKDANIAYIQLSNHKADSMLLIHYPDRNVVEGYQFHGAAKKAQDWYMEKVTELQAPFSFKKMTALGEDDLIFYNDNMDYKTWSLSWAGEDGYVVARSRVGNGNTGTDCRMDNATACVSKKGCGWCPSTYTCHPYDRVDGVWCDHHKCTAPALLDAIVAGQSVIVPDCVSNPDPESVHADVFDALDEGFDKLPGHLRLNTEYRNNAGDHAQAEAAPIHPAIDNELGEDPVIVDEDNQATLIHENNQVSQGSVYQPPPPSKSAPCMDNKYDASKADVVAPDTATWKMNMQPGSVKIFTTSPSGDAGNGEVEAPCARPMNVSGRTNATRKVATRKANIDTGFIPRPGDNTKSTEEFNPATSTKHEEDLMNNERTPFADLKAQWLNKALPKDNTRTQPKMDGEKVGFHPREPAVSRVEPSLPSMPSSPALRTVSSGPTSDLMNAISPSEGLINPDRTATGGADATSTLSFSSAMQNSHRNEFPETLEQQLQMFKHEARTTRDTMEINSMEDSKARPVALPSVETQ